MFRIALTLAAAGIASGVLSRGAASAHGSPRYQDHFLRIHPSARNGAAAKVVQRRAEIVEHRRSLKEADELAKRVHEVGHDNLSADERRRLIEAENKFGALYYAYGEDSSTWIVNGVELDYSGIDCDWVPGWQQKLDTNPDTDWSYSTTAANSVGPPFADDAMVGYESVCAGETTPQDPAIPNALPTIPCALICLPWQAAVSGAKTQTANDSLRMLMPAETSTKAQTVLGLPDVPAAPLVLANDGYEAWYGYAAPDPYGSPPICETYIKDCTYSKEPMRTYTAADGSEVKWPRHDPFGLGDVRSAEEKEAAPDGVCSLSDAKTQWMDCAIPCPAPYEVSEEEIRRSYGVVAVCFMVVCSLLGLIALIKVGKDPVNYFVAGRGLPWWMIAATLGTTSLDAGVSMGALDYGYLYHWWDGAVLPISIGISQIVMAVFFAKPMFDMKLLTLPDLFAIKFGRANEMAFVVIFFISFAVLLAAQIVGAGKLISHVLFGGQSEIPGIWLCAFCIWLYTVTGGLFSVVYTDLVQGIFGWTGMMAGTIYVILNFPLAPGVGPAYPLGDKPMFWEGMSDPDAYDPIPDAIVFNWATIFVLGMGCVTAPDFQARIFAAKSSKAAIFGCIFGAIITWVFGCCWAFVPAAARALYGPGSPHAEFVADSCNRHITVIGCFGPGNIETDPALNPGCTGNGIEGCDPKVRNNFCNAVPLVGVPTCGEWKPDKYGPLKMLTCYKEECNGYTDFLGDSGIEGTYPGWTGNFPMPPFMGGWMLLVILAASMSSGDGCILACATIFSHNVLEKFGVTRKGLLKATRWSTVLWTIVSAAISSAAPDKTGYLLIVSFDIATAGALIPLFVAVYWPTCNPIAVFCCFVSGSLTRIILEFALPKDGSLVIAGEFAETSGAGIYGYDDFKKFTNWDLATGGDDAVDYGVAGKIEACPQKRLEDWTGIDSFLSPAIGIVVLVLVHLLAPKPSHKWFQPVSHKDAVGTGEEPIGVEIQEPRVAPDASAV